MSISQKWTCQFTIRGQIYNLLQNYRHLQTLGCFVVFLVNWMISHGMTHKCSGCLVYHLKILNFNFCHKNIFVFCARDMGVYYYTFSHQKALHKYDMAYNEWSTHIPTLVGQFLSIRQRKWKYPCGTGGRYCTHLVSLFHTTWTKVHTFVEKYFFRDFF